MAAPNSYLLVLRAAPVPSADVIRIIGTKKNNDVPPGPTNIGTLPGVATVALPGYGEGKQVALSTDLLGRLRVFDTSGSGGISQADLTAFFEAVTSFNPIGGERQDVTITIPNGKAGVARLTPFRAIHLNLRDSGGVELLGQKLMAGSVPVTVASDQPPIPTTIVPSNAATGISTGIRTLGGGTAGSLNVIRATTYNEQTVDAQRSFTSSSASDTGAGTGAQQVTLTYYNSLGAGPFTEVVTLAGAVAVATVATNICFIEKMVVTRAGSVGANVGTITLFVNNTGGGGTIGTIGLASKGPSGGDRRTLWAHHYVAAGITASLATLVVGTSSATSALFFLRAKQIGVTGAVEILVSDLVRASTTSVVRVLAIPIKVVGPALVTTYGIPDQNSAVLSASFDFSEA